ncbi:hypothetical protein PMAYCL1PPCAC_26264, partial [Pristionchus mayeri]
EKDEEQPVSQQYSLASFPCFSEVQESQSMDAFDKTFEEGKQSRKLTPAPTLANHGAPKNIISLAPRKFAMNTEQLVKMISDTGLGAKIDAMIEAGPDGEEEELLTVQKGEAAASEEAVDDKSKLLTSETKSQRLQSRCKATVKLPDEFEDKVKVVK